MPKTRLAALVFGLVASAASAAEPPDALLDALGFDRDDVEAMHRGEIVTRSEPELEHDRAELAVSAAMLVATPVEHYVEVLTGTELFRLDRMVHGAGRIDFEGAGGDDSAAWLDAIRLDARDANEIRMLLAAEPGDELNLHASEIEAIRRLAEGEGDPEVVAQQAVRDVLGARVDGYRARGLDGVLPYTRARGKETYHAAELTGIPFATSVIAHRSPELFSYLHAYPETEQDAEVEERFYWVRHDVVDRPAYSLIHWAYQTGPEGTFLVEREFYVSHTYNAQQVHMAVMRYEGKTLAVYVSHLFTDRVAGFGSAIAHRVGRGKVEDAIREHLQQLRESL